MRPIIRGIWLVLFVALAIPAAARGAPRLSPADVAARNERTIATLFDGLPAGESWNSIVFHHSATAGGSKQRFDAGHRRKFDDPDGMEYHFLIGSGIGSPDGLIEVGDRWQQQMLAFHLFTHARDRGSIAICLVGNFELPGRTPSAAQLRAVTALTRALAAKYNIPTEALTTHRGIDGRLTQCPGKNFPLARIKQAMAVQR
jgi:N-acetylmuramoyl-L-alanine amidase